MTTASSLKLKRIDNLDLVVSDFEGVAAFYRGVLQLDFAPEGYKPEKGWAMFRCGNVDVVLMSAPGSGRPRQRTSEYWTNPAGFDSFAFEVDDIDVAMAHLNAASVTWAGDLVIYGNGKVLSRIPTDFDGIWYRYRSFYDPNGNMLHLTEPHFPESHPLHLPDGERGRDFRLKRVDNLDIVVADHEGMVGFYRDVLGWGFAASGYQPEKRWAMFDCGNIDVVLLGVPGSGRPQERTHDHASNPAGFDSMAFEVDDLELAMAVLDGSGVRWAGEMVIDGNGEHLTEPPGEGFPGIWYRYRSFYDPEGNLLHLTEPHPATASSEAGT